MNCYWKGVEPVLRGHELLSAFTTLYQVCAQDTAPRNELDSPVGLVDVVLWGAKRTGQEAQPFGRRRLLHFGWRKKVGKKPIQLRNPDWPSRS